jgi:hypothetical protein
MLCNCEAMSKPLENRDPLVSSPGAEQFNVRYFIQLLQHFQSLFAQHAPSKLFATRYALISDGFPHPHVYHCFSLFPFHPLKCASSGVCVEHNAM